MAIARYLPRFRQAYREMETLASRENWCRPDIESFQLERLNQVWQHAVEHVPYYRRLQSGNDLPPRFECLEEFQNSVPVLEKPPVRSNPHDFFSCRAERGFWTRTGGSTGQPMRCFWGKQAHLEMLRTKYRAYDLWGLDIFERTAYLWGHSASLAPGLPGKIARVRMVVEDWLRQRIRLSAYDLGHHELQDYLRRIAAFGPAVMYGYPSAMDLLAREAETTGFTLDCLRLMTITGEPALPSAVDRLQRVFGAPAAVEYGSTECGTLAMEGPDRTLRVREDIVLLETLPRDDGRYDIVVTMLHNPSFPLLRYVICDVTDAPLTRPETGFAILNNVAGRNNDFIVSRAGRYLHSSRFDAFFKKECRGIRHFRMRQRSDGAIYAAVQLDGTTTRVDVADIESRLRNIVEGHAVRVEVVPQMPKSPSGKHRFVVSELVTDQSVPSAASHAWQTGGPKAADENDNPTANREPCDTAHTARRTADGPQRLPTKAGELRRLITRPQLDFAMEAHNGLSAKIVEEAGFSAIWASGLSISAALGVRDSNEASWTQVLEMLEFMSDSTRIPILVDGDTGYGNFNNMRRLVRKLEQRHIAGVCIEDKLFPKTNSFIRGTAQPLAEIDEFCGRVKAGKDIQQCDDFVIVARVEALIAGWGMDEALKRADAYHAAGADAILMHSSQRTADEVTEFKRRWGDRSPVVIVPTKYYHTPTDLFREHGFSLVIWANHLMRSCITAMQRTAQQVFEDESLAGVEDRIAPIAEVFRLQGTTELAEAERRYLPTSTGNGFPTLLAAANAAEVDAASGLPLPGMEATVHD